jgi:hypothetical protein
MRKLLPATLVVFGIVLAARPTPARADIGLGLFVGDPLGVDLKVGVGNRSALDILLGFTTFRDGRDGYGHLTYLVTPVVGQGRSVLVPLRIGIGAAIFGSDDDLDFAIRAPFQVGLRLRRTPLEFYGEVALAIILFDEPDDVELDIQGGLGFRLYF